MARGDGREEQARVDAASLLLHQVAGTTLLGGLCGRKVFEQDVLAIGRFLCQTVFNNVSLKLVRVRVSRYRK